LIPNSGGLCLTWLVRSSAGSSPEVQLSMAMEIYGSETGSNRVAEGR
jgi:hypothetical protein